MKRNLRKYEFVARPAMLFLLICWLPFTMLAQSKKITGKVFSASTSEVFPGVNIILKGNTNKGTITDNQGMFSIDAAPGDVLVFSFIGFKTKEVKIGSEATLSVPLEDGVANVDSLAFTDVKDKTQIGIEIHSGRNRIVRRIFEHYGYDVKNLDRVIFAGLTKKNVERGKWRFLSEKEVRDLKYFKKGK